METGIVAFSVYAFTSIFVIVNPVGGIVPFFSLTDGMSAQEKREVARRSVTVACILAIIFALAGEIILRIFNITVDSLRVAGGIFLFIIAIEMIRGRTSRESITPEEMKDASRRADVSVFPIATPLLMGPGAITTVIVVIRTGKSIELKAVTILSIILTFLIAYLLFRYIENVYRMLGVTVTLVITRIMGLLLGAIAVNFVATGAWNIYRSFI